MTSACASGLFREDRRDSHGRTHAREIHGPDVAFEIEPRGPFSLDAAREFLEGFTPAAGAADTRATQLRIAFRADRSFAPAVASITQSKRGTVRVHVIGLDDREAARQQVARILSLHVDATEWPAIGARDPVVRSLQARYPGSRPVVFPSPYEAAAWGVLAQRISMRVAAKWKRALAETHGDRVRVGDDVYSVFPGPAALREVRSCDAIPHEKLVRLHAVAEAALAGELDANALRAMPRDAAIERLETIHGIGHWTASHILLRGCGIADADPTAEPRVLRGFAAAYGLGHVPTAPEYARASRSWRPFGMWVAVLLVRSIAETPAWHGPEQRGR